MLENSGVTSEHFMFARMELSDKDFYSSGREYVFDEPFVFEREPSVHFPLKEDETNSLGQSSKKIILFDIWSVNDFPISMTKDVYGRFRPHFQIPYDVPIRKGANGEKCYVGRLHKVGFYEVAFIEGLRLPLSHLHHQLVD